MIDTERAARRPLLAGVIPRPLELPTDAGGTVGTAAKAASAECVTIVNSVLTHAHLDRTSARRLGWRGIRPSFTHLPAWTARIARRDFVYGLVFIEENAEGGVLLGRFVLYAFPDRDEAGVPNRSPEVRAEIEAEDWPDRIRAVSANARALAHFVVGEVELAVDAAGQGLEITFTARRTLIERDAEGRPVGRVRALASGLPFFTALAETFAALWGADVPVERILWAERPKLYEGEHDDGTIEVSLTLAAGTFAGLLPGKRMKAFPFLHHPGEEERLARPIVHVLSGFLGAGKTTFLREWLEFLHGRERFTGVIQNEFGEVDLDSLVLKGTTRVEAIDEGCVCCTLADSLRPGLERLMAATPAEQFVIETTGLARPSAVMDALLVLNDMVRRGLLITIIDARDCIEHPERLELDAPGEEAACRKNQIENADVLVCSKADAVDPEALEALEARLHGLNPEALILPAVHGAAPFAVLDAFYWHAVDRKAGRFVSHDGPAQGVKPAAGGFLSGGLLRNEPRASEFEQFSRALPEPLSESDVETLIEMAGEGLVRAKGVVALRDRGPVLVHYVPGHLTYEGPATVEGMEEAGEAPESRFLVFIGKNLVRPAGSSAADGAAARRTDDGAAPAP